MIKIFYIHLLFKHKRKPNFLVDSGTEEEIKYDYLLLFQYSNMIGINKNLINSEKGKENGIDYKADLTDWQREQLLKRTHWWRVEIRVRRDKANAEISEEELFQSFHLVKPCFETSNRIQEQALIFFLTVFPEKIQQMNYRTKKRAEDILINSSEFDLVSVLRLAFVQNQHKLEYQLKDYLSSTHLHQYDVDILYTSDEKLGNPTGRKHSIR